MSPQLTIYEEHAWRDLAAQHLERVRPWTETLRARRSASHPHPVHDFLFTYYSYRPSQLESWHPGLGAALRFSTRASVEGLSRNRRYAVSSNLLYLDPAQFTDRDRRRSEYILQLLHAVDSRPPRFGCAGLHEWAMVYRVPQTQIRHNTFPLRLSTREIAAVVDSNPITCTHHDAFRFFSKPARPLNTLQPSRESAPALEQSGCLHANMDLYKWAYKLSPWISSTIIADAFALARKARELDMRASPYDLSRLGFDPIPIETAGGRSTYEAAQRQISSDAAPLRKQLLQACRHVLAQTPPLQPRKEPFRPA